MKRITKRKKRHRRKAPLRLNLKKPQKQKTISKKNRQKIALQQRPLLRKLTKKNKKTPCPAVFESAGIRANNPGLR